MNDPSALRVSRPWDGPLTGRGAATVIGWRSGSLSLARTPAARTTSVLSWIAVKLSSTTTGALFVTVIAGLVLAVLVPSETSVAVTVAEPGMLRDVEGAGPGDQCRVGGRTATGRTR